MTEATEIAALLDDVRMRTEAGQPGGFRLILEVPERIGSVPPDVVLEALRRALVHEGRLGELTRELNAELGTEEFIGILGEVVQRVAVAPSGDAIDQFTEAEARELEKAGIDISPLDGEGLDPAVRTAGLYAELLASALTTREAAALLDVDESRVRQRLQARSLYGVKLGRAWKLPRFQFTPDGVVPGIDRVIARLPEDLNLVALYRWLTTPNPDLVVDGEALSPLDWLRTGSAPELAAELAAEL